MTSDSAGTFVWYELMTTDAEAAEAYYRAVIGWTAKDAGMPGFRYTLLSVGDTAVGGLMALSPEECAAGAKPKWIGYIGVDDVDAYEARVPRAGGAVHRTAEDIPGIGRFAVAADPQGATFVLFKGAGQPPAPPAPNTPGLPSWHELHATDWEPAFAFYAGMFGWRKADALDMGPMGTYQLFSAGADPIGGMMSKNEAIPSPFWLFYFNVDDIDAAAKRVSDKGGQVMHGPHEVPGGGWIVQCRDPQGAMFALVGPRG